MAVTSVCTDSVTNIIILIIAPTVKVRWRHIRVKRLITNTTQLLVQTFIQFNNNKNQNNKN